jgi:hypothetical protein
MSGSPYPASRFSIHGKKFPAAGQKSICNPSPPSGAASHLIPQTTVIQRIKKYLPDSWTTPPLPARALPYTLWFFIGYWI